MVQNFGFGSAEEGALTLALVIGLGFLILSLPYMSTGIDEANLEISNVATLDINLPFGNDWGANGTFVKNTENVSGTLQTSDTTESGIYRTDSFAGVEERTLDLDRFTYNATIPGNSEVIVQIGVSSDDFTSVEERENYTLNDGAGEVATNDFNETFSYVLATIWLNPSGGGGNTIVKAPTLDAAGFEGTSLEKTDESIPSTLKNTVFFIIIVFALAWASWLIVGM